MSAKVRKAEQEDESIADEILSNSKPWPPEKHNLSLYDFIPKTEVKDGVSISVSHAQPIDIKTLARTANSHAFATIQSMARSRSYVKVFEVGPGQGAFFEYLTRDYALCKKVHYTGVEPNPNYVRHMDKLIEKYSILFESHPRVLSYDARNIPLEYKDIDVIILIDVGHEIRLRQRPDVIYCLNDRLAKDGEIFFVDLQAFKSDIELTGFTLACKEYEQMFMKLGYDQLACRLQNIPEKNICIWHLYKARISPKGVDSARKYLTKLLKTRKSKVLTDVERLLNKFTDLQLDEEAVRLHNEEIRTSAVREENESYYNNSKTRIEGQKQQIEQEIKRQALLNLLCDLQSRSKTPDKRLDD